MHYYRYRSGSELSFKELIYNEIYFGSPEECNDPYDSKAFYEFPKDAVRWRRLLDQALRSPDETFKSFLLDDLVRHVCTKSPMTLEDVMTKGFLNTEPLNKKMQAQTLMNMEAAIRQFIGNYIPITQYFACFSSSPTNMLMWSHYANNHKGFCLIFKAVDGKLKQSNTIPQKQIRRKTPHGIAEEMSYAIHNEFEFHPVSYRETVEPLNAFKCMSQHIFGETISEEEINKLRLEQYSHFLQKEHCWQYEKESRLILSPPPAWLFGGPVGFTPHERLFYYQPTQLVGVIMGSKMQEDSKTRLTEIIKEKRATIHQKSLAPYVLFDFVSFEARTAANQRAIELHPIEILGVNKSQPGDKDFEERLQRWEDGWGLDFYETAGCRKIQIA